MKTALAGIVLTVAVLGPTVARAQGAPAIDPNVNFMIYGSQMSLHSLDGTVLPINVSNESGTLTVRSYSDTMMEDQTVELTGEPAFAEVSHGNGYSEMSVDSIFGDLNATAGYSGSSHGWATSDFMFGANAVFTLPANSFLTMVGGVQVTSTAAANVNYMSFERSLLSGTEGAFGDIYVLSGANASGQYTITAINPLDEEATFYYYTTLFGIAFSRIAPVPEPSTAAMLGGGLLLLLGAGRRKARPPTANQA